MVVGIFSPYGAHITRRVSSPEAEELLYRPNAVGNRSHIMFRDYMGGDQTVAWVATAGRGTNIFPENPSTSDFLHYLVAHHIWDPFKFVQFSFLIKSNRAISAAIIVSFSISPYGKTTFSAVSHQAKPILLLP